jgi:hypothetical protein
MSASQAAAMTVWFFRLAIKHQPQNGFLNQHDILTARRDLVSVTAYRCGHCRMRMDAV